MLIRSHLIILSLVMGLFWLAGSADAIKTKTGLEYEDTRMGKGEAAKIGDTVVVHYTGWIWLKDKKGKLFDTSRRDGRSPFSFELSPPGKGRVIKGWDEGLVGMKPKGIRTLKIPPELGYGERPVGPIPGNSTLFFEVELLDIKRANKS